MCLNWAVLQPFMQKIIKTISITAQSPSQLTPLDFSACELHRVNFNSSFYLTFKLLWKCLWNDKKCEELNVPTIKKGIEKDRYTHVQRITLNFLSVHYYQATFNIQLKKL